MSRVFDLQEAEVIGWLLLISYALFYSSLDAVGRVTQGQLLAEDVIGGSYKKCV